MVSSLKSLHLQLLQSSSLLLAPMDVRQRPPTEEDTGKKRPDRPKKIKVYVFEMKFYEYSQTCVQ
jgi:hypothetical protein